MSGLEVGGIVFVCVYGGALLGILLSAILPKHQLAFESVTSVMGMIQRRLAEGQELAQDTSRAGNASQ
jgi:hypothetical protein